MMEQITSQLICIIFLKKHWKCYLSIKTTALSLEKDKSLS